MAFREETGEFLWQATFDKLASGRANDWPFQGIASSPLIIRNVAYFTTNRGTIIAVDIEGFHDNENDGPIKDEKLTGKHDPDIIWSFDMIEEVGAFPHNLANCSPVADGGLLYCSTGNGQDESHVNVPSPKAPSIIALEIESGKLRWEDNSVGEKVLHGQWSTPAVGDIGGVRQVVHAQGDGWVRGYEAQSGKKLWEFDTNPKDSVWPKTRWHGPAAFLCPAGRTSSVAPWHAAWNEYPSDNPPDRRSIVLRGHAAVHCCRASLPIRLQPRPC
jgi:outer membrane protein assembly factor BamB